MNRNPLQIKELLPIRKSGKTKYNREPDEKQILYTSNKKETLNRFQSLVFLQRNQNFQMKLFQERFQNLQHNYKSVLEGTKQKRSLFKKQQKELEILKLQTVKNKQQIQRLRALLGFLPKKDAVVQTNSQNTQKGTNKRSQQKKIYKVFYEKKVENSIELGTKQSITILDDLTQQNSKIKTKGLKKCNRLLNNKSQTTISTQSSQKKNRIQSLSRYKFMPSYTFA